MDNEADIPRTDTAKSQSQRTSFGKLHNTLLGSAEPNGKALSDLINVRELS